MQKRIRHERDDQKNLVKWFYLQYPKEIIISIPNDLVRTCVQARNATYQGLVSGVPDLFIPIARNGFHGLWIEMKRMGAPGHRKGIVSERQAKMLEYLSNKNYRTSVCFGFESAKLEIETYLGSRYENK